MIRIGLVNIDTSHPKAFADYLQRDGRARYVAVYNDGFRGDDEVEGFIKTYGLEKRCSSIEELADMSDIGFIQSCNWDRHIEQAMPFLQRGKPVFIDKPAVGNMKDCIALRELAKDGHVILGSSSVRYAYEIVDFIAKPEEERGKIMNIYGTSGVDEFNYGIHIVEAIGGLLGVGATSVKFGGRSVFDDKTCETFTVKYDDGTTATYNTFHGLWMPFHLVIMTTKGTYHFMIDTGKIYGALLDRICDYMETGEDTLAPVEHITESIEIMMAGKISRDEGGREVSLAAIPENYSGYNGYAFEEGYAAAAKKMYI